MSAVAQAPQKKLDLVGIHILVVDDTDDLREILKMILNSKGANVEVARDGAEAIQMAQIGTYDVILMDMRMPGLDGNDTARKIRSAADDKLKIIALTGDVDAEKFQRKDSPFNAYVVKPIDPGILSETILKTMAS